MTSEKKIQANRLKAAARLMTTEQFVEKAKLIHGERYDYSKTEYTGALNKVTVTCRVHGDFTQKANAHQNGNNCPKCGKLAQAAMLSEKWREYRTVAASGETPKGGKPKGTTTRSPDSALSSAKTEHEAYKLHKSMPRKPNSTTEQFIAKARAIHGDKYDYNKTVYVASKEKVIITCPEHGDFEQTPKSHLRSDRRVGCPKCGRTATASARRLNVENFVEKARAVHGDKYDYSKVVYLNNHTKIIITCPEHGDFEQAGANHLQGQGCPKCAQVARTTAKRSSQDEFLNKTHLVHGNTYDYSKVVYVDAMSKVRITCKLHGVFEQVPHKHLSGQGCPVCGRDKITGAPRSSTEEFIVKARAVHGDKYDYSKVVYTVNTDKVSITCPKHGDFEQIPSNHIKGNGCPSCGKNTSQPELDIKALIESYGYEAVHRYRPAWMQKRELDLFVPALNLAIEYCGYHVHNVDRNLLGGEPKSKTYHYDKWKLCRDNGVTLLTIFDFQWLNKREKVEALLRHKLQSSDRRVYARKCEIVELDRQTCWDFVKINHIEGCGVWKHTCNYKGLTHKGELVAVMVEEDGDIKRSCTLQGTAVIGGVSRLFKAFPKGTTMMTTNDTGSSGEYGTRLDKYTLRYWWVNGRTGEALTRNNCMKHKLEARFGIPVEGLTEREYMLERGYVRVFDAGLSFFVNY